MKAAILFLLWGNFCCGLLASTLQPYMMSDDVVWPRSVVKTLCKLAEEHRCLWDRRDAAYLNRKLRMGLFNKIAMELKTQYPIMVALTGDKVRVKFKKLKSYFIREHRKIQSAPSDLAGKISTRWEFYDWLTFLSANDEELLLETSWSGPTHHKNIMTNNPWSRSVRVSLCEIVGRHRSLWDSHHPDYLIPKIRMKEYSNVARELEARHPGMGSLTEDKVRSEFNKHKSYFIREYKKLQAADSGGKPSKWEFYDCLTFLSDHAEETLAKEKWSGLSETKATAAGGDSRDSIAWSSEATLSLLDKVQEEEAIWDTRHPSYYEKNLKRAVYEELCTKMKEEYPSLNNLTADDVVARFAHLRSHFQKQLQEIDEAPLGSAGRCMTRWEYFEACSFLLPVYCHDMGVSNFQLPSSHTGDQVVYVDMLEDPLDTGEAPEGVDSPPSPSSTTPAPSPPPPTSEAPAAPGDMSKPAVSPSSAPQCSKKRVVEQDTPQGRQGSCVPTLPRPATRTMSLKRRRETDRKDLMLESILKTVKRVHSLAQSLESREEPTKLDLASQTVLSIMQYIPDSHQDLRNKFIGKVMSLAAETVAEYNGRISEGRKES
ncbi:uncharacterized protein LOC126992513 [Eriocheir sinensis]|uniref:uncharacterized protein LOC126992513 n=1 Tax=Eriocheir sinensis TaxID=95602 RepID=UPI0021C8C39D|nr:uncharacterized protein LOC126992513 [Eriocheir sinensis]